MELPALAGLFLAFSSAFLLAEVCRFFRIPRVVGQVIAGLLLGFLFADFFSKTAQDLLSAVASIGIVLLFFFVGMELSVRQFRQYVRTSLLISFFNTMIPLVAGTLIGLLFGYNPTVAIIIGITLAVSAQAISIDLLDELGLLKTKIGTLIITAGAVDDVFEFLLIAVILAWINTAITGVGLLGLFAQVGLFVLLLLLLRFVLLPRFVEFLEREKTQIGLFSGALLITLFVAAAADMLAVGAFIGALFAGLILREILVVEEHRPWEAHSITRQLHLISFGFFIPIFFIWVGFNTSLLLIAQNLPFALLLLITATVGTVGGTILGVLANKGTLAEGVTVGWGLNPKGDVELVIALMALQKGIIDQSLFSSIVFMALGTTLVSPLIFQYYAHKHAKVLADGKKQKLLFKPQKPFKSSHAHARHGRNKTRY